MNTIAKVIRRLLAQVCWASLLVVFSYLTVRTSSILLLDFVTEKPFTRAKIEFQTVIALPPSTVCLPIINYDFYSKELNESGQDDFFWQNSIESEIRSDKLTKQNLADVNQRWSKSFIYLAHRYLACITYFEYPNAGNKSCFNNETTDDFFAARDILDYQLAVSDMTTQEFRQRFGIEIAILYSLKLYDRSSSQIGGEKEDWNVTTYVTINRVCLQMRLNRYPFNKGIKNALILEATPPLVNIDERFQAHLLLKGNKIVVDFDGRPVVKIEDSDNNHVFTALFCRKQYVSIGIAAKYRAKSTTNGQIRCDENHPLHVCQFNCRQEYISRECNCTPTFNGLTVS
uniref:Uncharacterized protein n=1 Tax=Plectus sambesii TaxID=2011161 RepID=A0A914X521_9BILA